MCIILQRDKRFFVSFATTVIFSQTLDLQGFLGDFRKNGNPPLLWHKDCYYNHEGALSEPLITLIVVISLMLHNHSKSFNQRNPSSDRQTSRRLAERKIPIL